MLGIQVLKNHTKKSSVRVMLQNWRVNSDSLEKLLEAASIFACVVGYVKEYGFCTFYAALNLFLLNIMFSPKCQWISSSVILCLIPDLVCMLNNTMEGNA